MKGAIIINGYYESKAYLHQIERIKEEFSQRGFELETVKNNKAFFAGKTFDYDFVIFLDKDIYLARTLEQSGVIVFNNSFALDTCDDKIKTAIALSKHNDIFMPKTVMAPLRYEQIIDEEFIDQLEKALGYPMVAKKAKGSLGSGIILINNREELEKIEKEWSIVPHLYQVFVEESKGKSVRAYVVGNKVIGSMMLTNEADFRSNASQGSEAYKVELNESYTTAAENISKYLELDFCAVDFFAGGAMVIEVNSNAFFKKMEEISAINIAGSIAEYVINFLKEIGQDG